MLMRASSWWPAVRIETVGMGADPPPAPLSYRAPSNMLGLPTSETLAGGAPHLVVAGAKQDKDQENTRTLTLAAHSASGV